MTHTYAAVRSFAFVSCAFILTLSTAARADYQDDIGFRLLQLQLGAGMPTGAGVPVMHVEVPQIVYGVEAYLPDPGNGEFAGKTITPRSGSSAGVYSGHATAVGQLFYGNSSSTAPGIYSVDAYKAIDWLFANYLRTANSQGRPPLISGALVANHSWVSGAAPYDAEILSRLDWVIARDEFTNVIGLNNASPNPPLFSSAYNVIAVGRSTGEHGRGSVAIGPVYTAGRTRPDLVAPAGATSTAAPEVAALAALLVGVGQGDTALSTDPVTQSVTSRSGTVIRNAARSEVIKAILMAGASRSTANSSTSDITDYRAIADNQASNGLDIRFGAGQINILNSHEIITSGEQNSLEDYPAGSGVVSARGFDYDPHFGGSGSINDTATYFLPMPATNGKLTVALVWNLKIHGGTTNTFNSTATFYNLDLELLDVTNASNWVSVGYSRSTGDNTENLWLPLTAGRQYALRVTLGNSQADDFDWDYALAWHTIPEPWVDTDGDGVTDPNDNCTMVPNPEQCDSDGDGFGNRCDGDLNNNGFTNAQDYVELLDRMGEPSTAPGYNIADLNCNGWVNAQDYLLLRSLLGPPPGPSGLVSGESP